MIGKEELMWRRRMEESLVQCVTSGDTDGLLVRKGELGGAAHAAALRLIGLRTALGGDGDLKSRPHPRKRRILILGEQALRCTTWG